MISGQRGQRAYSGIERKASKRAGRRSRKNRVTRKRWVADRNRKRAMSLSGELRSQSALP